MSRCTLSTTNPFRFAKSGISVQRDSRETSRQKRPLRYTRASLFEREAVSDDRAILREALRGGMGETREHFLSIASYTTYALSIMLRKKHKKRSKGWRDHPPSWFSDYQELFKLYSLSAVSNDRF